VPIIALVGRRTSRLAGEATIALDASVREEACPHDLAPTSSTTAALVLGDALAMALLDRRQVSKGDLRRLLQKTTDISTITAGDAMTRDPKTVRRGSLAVVALQEMELYNITQIVVVDARKHPVGVVHLHDLVKAGLGGDDQP
jgi:arabinose-5-phosphate isomerase